MAMSSYEVSRDALPDVLREAADAFGRHLQQVAGRSPHTVRAYLGDVVSLLDHAAAHGVPTLDALGISVVRGWLAAHVAAGAARSSQARRAAAARAFTGWAHRDGRTRTDVAALLVTPRAHR